MKSILLLLLLALLLLLPVEASGAAESTAQNIFHVTLPAPSFAEALRPESPFGINTAFHSGAPDLDARLRAMQQAGIKWGRQDFNWRRIEKAKGSFEWEPYDCFDIACLHPYRNPNAPEDKFDWWVLDQYVKQFHKELTPEFPMVHQSFLDQTDELIKTMGKFGKPKPLWVTEMCFNTHIHPYGVSELRSADLTVRFHLLAIASGKIEKVFWWTLKDGGQQQFDAAEMVGLARADLTPKYAYYAYSFMTRMLEGKKWVRNDSFEPDVYAVIFAGEGSGEETMALWSPKPFAYVRIRNTVKGLTFYDVYGTKRFVPYEKVRTSQLPVPLGESPIYVVGPKGLKATVRADPGW